MRERDDVKRMKTENFVGDMTEYIPTELQLVLHSIVQPTNQPRTTKDNNNHSSHCIDTKTDNNYTSQRQQVPIERIWKTDDSIVEFKMKHRT